MPRENKPDETENINVFFRYGPNDWSADTVQFLKCQALDLYTKTKTKLKLNRKIFNDPTLKSSVNYEARLECFS